MSNTFLTMIKSLIFSVRFRLLYFVLVREFHGNISR